MSPTAPDPSSAKSAQQDSPQPRSKEILVIIGEPNGKDQPVVAILCKDLSYEKKNLLLSIILVGL